MRVLDRLGATWSVFFHATLGKRISAMRILFYLLERLSRACGYRLIRVTPGSNRQPSCSPYRSVQVYDNDWCD